MKLILKKVNNKIIICFVKLTFYYIYFLIIYNNTNIDIIKFID